MLARCSMTVVTMWLPFSLYISATPLRARLIDSVPPEVKTSSFGSRAPSSVDCALRLPSERMVAAGRMPELLGEVRQHRLDHARVARRRRLRVHEDRKLQPHRPVTLTQARLGRRTACGSHYPLIDSSSGTSALVSSARLMVSSTCVIAAWILWTGRRRLHLSICGHSESSRHETMLIGPSSARITCPTVMSVGRRAST